MRTACFCLLAILLVIALFNFWSGAVGLRRMEQNVPPESRRCCGAYFILSMAPRLLALAVCIYFAKVRTWQEFVSRFALRPFPSRFVILAALAGTFTTFFVAIILQDGFARIQFLPFFNLASLALIDGPFFEEAVMRGFFYRAFRNSLPLVVSVLLAFAIDTLMFHPRSFWMPTTLLAVGLVNVIACLLLEHTKSLWPPFIFHLACNIPFATFVYMR